METMMLVVVFLAGLLLGVVIGIVLLATIARSVLVAKGKADKGKKDADL